ncbi:LysR family transcriptional regulator [Burkholderia anthina]|uniref:LysR family transcriptional regulator n=1 Tax=Burkholderia anthina TaxID=179879 RepID=UPI001AA07334|nr:LysR family transcriptional regulator [Burkholderia anthina]QTD94940.1 LysR family transcriptional regulator [Burkholderia anthina]
MLNNKAVPFDLRGLEVFVAVCDNAGMAAAAKHLGISQPSVSLRINELEASLGLTLFDRTVRPALLTPVGAVLRDRARALISDASSIVPTLRKVGKSMMPFLRVGLIDSVSTCLFPTMLPYLSKHAEQVSILSGTTSLNAGELILRTLDVVVTSSSLDDIQNLERWPLVTEPYLIAVPKSLGRKKGLRELSKLAATLPLVRFSTRSLSGIQIDQYLRRIRMDVPLRIEVETCEQMAVALTQGCGWAITTPLCCVQGALDTSMIDFYPLPAPGLERELTLIARRKELAEVPAQLAKLSKATLQDVLANWEGNVIQ